MQHYIFEPYLVMVFLLVVFLSYVTSWVCDAIEIFNDENTLVLPHIIRVFLKKEPFNRKPLFGVLFFSIIMSLLFFLFAENSSIYVVILLTALCVPAAIMDFRFHIIPEEFTWALLFTGMLLSPWSLSLESSVIGAAVGCISIWVSMTLVGYLKGVDTRSGGDVAGASAAGAWVGIENLGGYLLAVSVVFIIACLIAHRKNVHWLPMGPALFISIPLAKFLSELINQTITKVL